MRTKVAYIRYRSRTVAIEVCLLFTFAVVFNFNVFPFPSSKAQSLGDVPLNRKKTQPIVCFEFDLGNLNKHQRWVFLRQYIDATMLLAPIGNAIRICCVNNFQI
jgi:hypothetical protein